MEAQAARGVSAAIAAPGISSAAARLAIRFKAVLPRE
jgi:hypothetical protein